MKTEEKSDIARKFATSGYGYTSKRGYAASKLFAMDMLSFLEENYNITLTPKEQ